MWCQGAIAQNIELRDIELPCLFESSQTVVARPDALTVICKSTIDNDAWQMYQYYQDSTHMLQIGTVVSANWMRSPSEELNMVIIHSWQEGYPTTSLFLESDGSIDLVEGSMETVDIYWSYLENLLARRRAAIGY